MGITAADFTGDGVGDLLVTNSRNQLHAAVRGTRAGASLFTDARRDFSDAFDTSLAGWGTSAVDLDLDGRPEIAIANGAVPVLDLGRDAQHIQILVNVATPRQTPRFVDRSGAVGLGAGPLRVARGLAAADFDNDGDPDLAINTVSGKLVLLRTTGRRGHWLQVAVEPFAPGVVVEVALPGGRTLVRELHEGSSYLSSEDPRLLFGLGSVDRVKAITVIHPDGTRTRRAGVRADQLITVAANGS